MKGTHRTYRCLLCLCLPVVVSCAAAQEGSSHDSRHDALSAQKISVEKLDCPRGGNTGPIDVAFACSEIVVVSCKDLSNVVLELADGSHVKIEGLQGHEATFSTPGELKGAEIVGAWVKAGANHSGDGPGYGEHFKAPKGTCDAPPEEDEPPPCEDPPGDGDPPAHEDPPEYEAPPTEDAGPADPAVL